MNCLEMLWSWWVGIIRLKFVKSKTVEKRPEKRCRKLPEPVDMIVALQSYLLRMYDFRYNRLTEETEFRKRGIPGSAFAPVNERELNSFCMDARQAGINCWDRDVSRYIHSDKVREYHPFRLYMDELPEWDGADRITEFAGRVSEGAVWSMGFHRWLLGIAAQWMGITDVHANSVAPLLVSTEQGKMKSTFCKVLMPEALQRYYTDSYDLSSPTQAERKLAFFGLVNLDEFDKILN